MEALNAVKRENINNYVSSAGIGIYNFQFPVSLPLKSYALETLRSNGSEDFYSYVQWAGLNKEKGIMVLLSVSHYHYDSEDLKGIRILINHKKLNYVKHLESYLHILFKALPADAYFLGCFKCNDKAAKVEQKNSGRIFYCSVKSFEPQPERLFTRKGVSTILEGHGYKLIDMTDFNGITYFCARIKKSE